ncbi:MAG: hypothetical protein WDA06_00965 [Phenylobacterium sp.]
MDNYEKSKFPQNEDWKQGKTQEEIAKMHYDKLVLPMIKQISYQLSAKSILINRYYSYLDKLVASSKQTQEALGYAKETVLSCILDEYIEVIENIKAEVQKCDEQFDSFNIKMYNSLKQLGVDDEYLFPWMKDSGLATSRGAIVSEIDCEMKKIDLDEETDYFDSPRPRKMQF